MMLAFLKVSILHVYIFIYSWKFPCGISRHLDLHPSGPSHYKLRMGWDKAREPQTRSLKGDSIQPTGHGSTYHSKQLKLLFFEKKWGGLFCQYQCNFSVNTRRGIKRLSKKCHICQTKKGRPKNSPKVGSSVAGLLPKEPSFSFSSE